MLVQAHSVIQSIIHDTEERYMGGKYCDKKPRDALHRVTDSIGDIHPRRDETNRKSNIMKIKKPAMINGL